LRACYGGQERQEQGAGESHLRTCSSPLRQDSNGNDLFGFGRLTVWLAGAPREDYVIP
jgi:hypothetical protein